MRLTVLFLLVSCAWMQAADNFDSLCADRTAIERVYYNHRLGNKPPFDQASPPALIERLVKQDINKEKLLKKMYGLELTPAQVRQEASRIHSSTRAPDVLAELEAALGNDPQRFARTIARPIVIERMLRERFKNDDKLHAEPRKEADKIRAQLLSDTNHSVQKLIAMLRQSNAGPVTEIVWQLSARPVEGADAQNEDEIEIGKRFGPNAQILSSASKEAERKFYFEDLPPALQEVLWAQLRRRGDISAVIELPDSLPLYVARERSNAILAVAVLSLPKAKL